MVLNFLHMTSYYREFRYALRVGDAVMIEWLYKEFLPLFRFTSKKHYFRIVCDMMDTFYTRLSWKLLHLVRINRTVPLYSGKDVNGRNMANWPLDGLIELIQKFYHKMNFKNDSLEGWMQHSAHLQLNNKSIRLAMTEYNRVFSEDGRRNKFGDGNENDLDPSKNRKPTAVPRRAQEHIAIAEFFQINKFLVFNNTFRPIHIVRHVFTSSNL